MNSAVFRKKTRSEESVNFPNLIHLYSSCHIYMEFVLGLACFDLLVFTMLLIHLNEQEN